MKKRLFLSLIWLLSIILLFFIIYSVQVYIDNSFQRNKEERLLYLPTGKFLKPLCLGYEALVSDFLWLKAIVYFGGHYLTDRSYKWLAHILDIVTTLDPYFVYPYEFGGIILALEEGNYQQSTALMEKGLQYHSEYWRLYFYLGFNYFFYHRNAKKASFYMSKAASLPGHPAYLPKLAASLLTKAGEKDEALSFLIQLYKNTDDEWLKDKIKQKIDDLLAGRLPKTLESIF